MWASLELVRNLWLLVLGLTFIFGHFRGDTQTEDKCPEVLAGATRGTQYTCRLLTWGNGCSRLPNSVRPMKYAPSCQMVHHSQPTGYACYPTFYCLTVSASVVLII